MYNTHNKSNVLQPSQIIVLHRRPNIPHKDLQIHLTPQTLNALASWPQQFFFLSTESKATMQIFTLKITRPDAKAERQTTRRISGRK